MTEKPAASKAAASSEKKADAKSEAKPQAKAPAKGGMGMGAGQGDGGGMGSAARGAAGAAPDPNAALRDMMLGTVDEMTGVLDGLRQKLGGGKVAVELDSGDVIIPAAMVGQIPAALRSQFETCVGCSANDLMASRRGQSSVGQKPKAGPAGKGTGPSGGEKPKAASDGKPGFKQAGAPSAMKSASTSSASRA